MVAGPQQVQQPLRHLDDGPGGGGGHLDDRPGGGGGHGNRSSRAKFSH